MLVMMILSAIMLVVFVGAAIVGNKFLRIAR
jgi:hypothetical protein